jgi:hypothetical protein
LEETIRVHESNLANLQAAHRSAADECLMLRYKNSLLERILLEKGIDVQAELRAKTGSPNLGPSHVPQNMVQPPPIQRAILSRHHHSRRSGSSIAPKLEPGVAPIPHSTHGVQHAAPSPTSRPTPSAHQTPSSHVASPTASTYGGQATSSPTITGQPPMRGGLPPQVKPHMPPIPGMANAARQAPMQQQQHGAGPRIPGFYSTQSFQSHIEQLEQEYDAPNEMMDDVEPDTPSSNPYSPTYPVVQQHGVPMQPNTSAAPVQASMGTAEHGSQTQGQGYPSMTQLLDPALDWDPFGLSASMAFPSQFSFDTSNMR